MTDNLETRNDEASQVGEDGADVFEDLGSELLRRAAAELLEWWRGGSGRPPARGSDLPATVARVARRVEELRSGSRSGPGGDDAAGGEARASAGSLLEVRVAQALRGRLLEEWEEGWREEGGEEGQVEGAEEVLELLYGIERYLDTVWPGRRNDPASRLADPDALELVVEMAHDLHSPLNSILFLAETLRTGHSGPVNEIQASQLALMYSAGLRIMSMVGDVMELAKRREPMTPKGAAPFSIHDVFETVRQLVRPMAEEKGIELDFRPPTTDGFVGHAVPLGRVLLNLTTNGLKFTEEGRVTVAAREVSPSVIEFSVTDTGRGIPANRRHLLFEPFQEPEGREGHFFSVSGLGLSIARRLVEAMGSELRYESEVGEGTRFYFRLRLPPESRTDAADGRSDGTKEKIGKDGRREKDGAEEEG